jgi:isopentenyl-diphosphate Delta-isomerase
VGQLYDQNVGNELVILVDRGNRRVGEAGKLNAHQQGLLHRAFSIFLVDAAGNLLLQQRAATKYHSAGTWANSCCGHPRPGEQTSHAAHHRLGEELGIRGVKLGLEFCTAYTAAVGGGLTENEYVYVYFAGVPKFRPRPHPVEVAAVRAVSLAELAWDAHRNPEMYAIWLRHYLRHHLQEITAATARYAGR